MRFIRHKWWGLCARLRTSYYGIRYRQVTFASRARCNGQLTIRGKGRVIVGPGSTLSGENELRGNVFDLSNGATVRIGADCYVNGVRVSADNEVTIGDRCIVGAARILTTDYHAVDPSFRFDQHAPVRSEPVIVEDEVWLANQTALLPGVTIGSGSVVAFGSVISRSVPPGCVIGSHQQRTLTKLA